MTSLSLIGPGRHGTAIAALFASHGVDVTLFHYRPRRLRRPCRPCWPRYRRRRSRSPRPWKPRPMPPRSSR